MTLREAAFVLALLGSAALVIYGVGLLSVPAGYITAGLGLGTGAWLVLSE